MRTGREIRADGEVGDDEESEDEKSADSHGPGETDLADEARDHDGEDYTAEGGTCCEDAECCAALFVEPSVDDVYCCLYVSLRVV